MHAPREQVESPIHHGTRTSFVRNPAHLDIVRKPVYHWGMNESTQTQVGPLMIGALVTIIGQEIRRRVTVALHAHGFLDYRPTYHDLFMFTRAEGSRITELAELAQVTRQSMSELVLEVERRGYVERTPDPTDRRAVLVKRTERGWQVNAIAREVVAQAQEEWTAQVGAQEYAEMLETLRQIVALIAPPPAGVAGHPRTLVNWRDVGPASKDTTASAEGRRVPGGSRNARALRQTQQEAATSQLDKEPGAS